MRRLLLPSSVVLKTYSKNQASFYRGSRDFSVKLGKSKFNWKLFSNTRLGFDRPLTCVIQVLVFRLSKPPTKPPWLPLGFYFFSSQGFCHCTLKCHSKFVTETSITLSVTLLKSKHFWQTKRFSEEGVWKKDFNFVKANCWLISLKPIHFKKLMSKSFENVNTQFDIKLDCILQRQLFQFWFYDTPFGSY